MEVLSRFLNRLLLSIFVIFSSTIYAGDYPHDIQRILNNKRIVIAMFEQDQPPFFRTSDKGELEGFDIELGKGIANALGVEAIFDRSPKTFNGTIDLVVNKNADIVISKLSKTLERSKKVLFTKPYVILRKGLLVNRLKLAQQKQGKSTSESIKTLTGKIGVIAGSSYVDFSRRMFPNTSIVEFSRWEEITSAVSQGELVAGFRDELEIKRFLKSSLNQAITLQSVVFKDTKDPIAIAVSADSRHLLYWLNEYLDSLNNNITADKLLDRYSYMFKENSDRSLGEN